MKVSTPDGRQRLGRLRKDFPHILDHPRAAVAKNPRTGVAWTGIDYVKRAGIFRRILAGIVDMVPMVLAWGLVAAGAEKYLGDHLPENVIGVSVWAFNLFFHALWFGLWESLTGASIGKFLFGVRILTDDLCNPTLGRAMKRNLVALLDGPILASVILAVMLYSPYDGRLMGDTAADTYGVVA
jgi:uncharacterized RDD family membrane protein YckC